MQDLNIKCCKNMFICRVIFYAFHVFVCVYVCAIFKASNIRTIEYLQNTHIK